ncbi:MAG: hypothetical protein L0K86_13400 [Actinomycetia bacterium]|nr:hypothetical protein [Actinomycetes bacterium]
MDEPLGTAIPVPVAGAYAHIDVAEQAAAITALHGPDPAAMVAAVLETPQRYVPPVLYAPAAVLFARGRRAEGGFWYYAAQLRARFDVRRCADPTVDGAVAILRERYGGADRQVGVHGSSAVAARDHRAVGGLGPRHPARL